MRIHNLPSRPAESGFATLPKADGLPFLDARCCGIIKGGRWAHSPAGLTWTEGRNSGHENATQSLGPVVSYLRISYVMGSSCATVINE